METNTKTQPNNEALIDRFIGFFEKILVDFIPRDIFPYMGGIFYAGWETIRAGKFNSSQIEPNGLDNSQFVRATEGIKKLDNENTQKMPLPQGFTTPTYLPPPDFPVKSAGCLLSFVSFLRYKANSFSLFHQLFF